MAALRGGYSHAMRHATFYLLAALWFVWIGQNWGHYSAALAVAAWIRYDGRLTARIF